MLGFRGKHGIYPQLNVISDTAKETVYSYPEESCIIRVRHHFPHRPVLWECADGRSDDMARSLPEALEKIEGRSRHNPPSWEPPTVDQIFDAVSAALISNLGAFDEFREKGPFYKKAIKAALEDKYGKIKPYAPTTSTKKKAKKATRERSKKIDSPKDLDIILDSGRTYEVELPHAAKNLAKFSTGDSAYRPGLQGVVWLPGDKLSKKVTNWFGGAPAGVFVATDGHRLGVFASDVAPPEGGVRFTAKGWAAAFKGSKSATGTIREAPELPRAGQFPDFGAVFGEPGRLVYNFDTDAVQTLITERPTAKLDNSHLVLRPRHLTRAEIVHGKPGKQSLHDPGEVTYRFMLPQSDPDITPFERLPLWEPPRESVKTTTAYNLGYFVDTLDLLGGGSVRGNVRGPMDPAYFQAAESKGAVVILMPVQVDAYEGVAPAAVKKTPSPVIEVDIPNTGANQHSPPKGKLERWVKKLLTYNLTQMQVAVGVYETEGGFERWMTNGINAIRLPVERLGRGAYQPQVELPGDALLGWIKVKWPTLDAIPGSSPDSQLSDPQIVQLDQIARVELDVFSLSHTPPLRGLTALTDQDREHMQYVGLVDDVLMVTDGHKGLMVTGIQDILPTPETFGVPPELFQGIPLQINYRSAYATSGHLLMKCRIDTDTPDLRQIIKPNRLPDKTIELTGPMLQRILKKGVAKKDGGVPMLVMDANGSRIDYLEFGGIGHSDTLKTTQPFLSELKYTVDEGIMINFVYFKQLIYAMTASPGSITMELKAPLEPVVFTREHQGMYITGVVMPIKIDY